MDEGGQEESCQEGQEAAARYAQHRRAEAEVDPPEGILEQEGKTILDIAREAYRELSGTASTICRHLGFAGIAIIWIFRTGEGQAARVPASLAGPAILVVASLTLDLL